MKFGIIIPTYNRPEYLRLALSSLLSQKYQDWVAVVANDGSTQDYSATERDFNDPRIIFVNRLMNGGCNAARNTAIDRAVIEGCDFISFLDDEETLPIHSLETAEKTINAHSAYGWYICNTYGETKPSSRKIIKHARLNWLDHYLYGKELRGDKMHFIRCSVLREIRFDPRYRASNMWPFYIRLGSRTAIYAFPDALKELRYLPTGITKTNQRRARSLREIYSRFGEHLLAIRYRPTKVKAWKYLLLELLKTPKRLFNLGLYKLTH
ncbi:glycosyltransferase family 2 protein [Pokkaliibacter sp. CJK22405]|uniref:glycosyltransferase family 2 protein n=1 Tax=Pokkaliibacter sp. CJK22405 TaxID=3384615 RepID=UPI0039850CDF